MTALESYALYRTLYLHFTTDNYDFIKYNGKINVSLENFQKRKDQYNFVKLAKIYTNIQDISLFYIANIVENNAEWSNSLLEDKAKQHYNKHKKTLQSMSYVFQNECEWLFEDSKDVNEILITSGGHYPKLLKHYLRSKIQLETLCILNLLLDFLPSWTKNIADDILWPTIERRIRKFTCFLPKDVVKYQVLLDTVLNKEL